MLARSSGLISASMKASSSANLSVTSFGSSKSTALCPSVLWLVRRRDAAAGPLSARHGPAAVRGDGRALDVTRVIADQEGGKRRDLLRFAETAHRHFGTPFGDGLLVIL